jgi:signal transduction histidine kinase
MVQQANRRSKWLLAALSLAILAVVGGADYMTGHEILFSTFYLVPVALVAWTVGRTLAILVSVLSVGVWLIGDFAAGATYQHPFVPVWNAAIVLAFYLVVVWLLTRLHEMQRDLEERVRLRTLALTDEIAERERLEREILDVSERERRRIGRDLHDSLGQLLTGTALAGQVLEERLASKAIAEATDVTRIVMLVEQGIELTRSLARGLDPVEIEGEGLADSFRELAAKTSEIPSTRCEYHPGVPVTVSDGVTATHLYRIAQEAITNAIKHGRARRIVVRLDGAPERVRLTVHDNGVGIADAHARGNGMGLRIMAHRAAVMGGTFEVRSEPSGGTTVICEMRNP